MIKDRTGVLKRPDGVVSPQPNPVRNRPVLSHLLGQLLLDSESLVRRLQT